MGWKYTVKTWTYVDEQTDAIQSYGGSQYLVVALWMLFTAKATVRTLEMR